MDEEKFNLSLRKFLKMVGVKSQHEIEQAVARALAAKHIGASAVLPATMTLDVAGINLHISFEGELTLE
jgi:hypothetical protein